MENGAQLADDSRKKRDSAEVVVKEEKNKKLRAAATTGEKKGRSSSKKVSAPTKSISPATNKHDATEHMSTAPKSKSNEAVDTEKLCERRTNRPSLDLQCDLEAAVQQIIRINCDNDNANNHRLHIDSPSSSLSSCTKEYLTNDQWISFRAGHAGDASMLASAYLHHERQQNQQQQQNDENHHGFPPEDVAVLELRLAESLGDEDNPPFLFALIVDLYKDNEKKEDDDKNKTDSLEPKSQETKMSAASLFQIVYAEGGAEKVLRVDWIYVADDVPPDVRGLLERRLWLRLSVLALKTSCHAVVAAQDIQRLKTDEEEENESKRERLSPAS
jgi:hypothetical protein